MSPFLLLLALHPAMAADLGFAGGPEWALNDPFQRTWGGRVGIEYALHPRIRVALGGSFYPDVGEDSWTDLARYLVDVMEIAPDLSRRAWQAQAVLRLYPFIHPIGLLEGHTGLYAGLSAVGTEDDLEMNGMEPDPDAQATARQVHPATLWGLCSEIGGGRVSGRLRVEQLTYFETVGSVAVEHKGVLFVGAEVIVWTGSR